MRESRQGGQARVRADVTIDGFVGVGMQAPCAKCGQPVNEKVPYCGNCGYAQRPAQRTCLQGHPATPGDSFCQDCGAAVIGAPTPAASQAGPLPEPPVYDRDHLDEGTSAEMTTMRLRSEIFAPEPETSAPEPRVYAPQPQSPSPAWAPEESVQPSQAQYRTPTTFGVAGFQVPLEILVVIGALLIMGVYTLYIALSPLSDVFKLIDGPVSQFGWVILLLLIIIAAFGAACLAIAYQLFRGDRVGRGLAYALALALAIGALSDSGADSTAGGSSSGGWRAVILIGCVVACALLGLAPASKRFFAESPTNERDRPAAVVVAQVLMAVNGGLVGLSALLYLLLGRFDGKYYAVGVGMLILASGYVAAYQLVGTAARLAPVLAAGVGVVTVGLQLIAGADSLGFYVGIGTELAVIASLWLNREAVTYFGRQPTWLDQAGVSGRASAGGHQPWPGTTGPESTQSGNEFQI